MDDESDHTPSESMHPVSGVSEVLATKQKRVPYKKMVVEAIETLKERRGSSRQSIAKFIINKYQLGSSTAAKINSVITKMVKNRQLIRTKGTLEDGAFKLMQKQLAPFASAGRSRRRRFRGRKKKGKKKRAKKGKKGRRKRRKGKKGKKGKKGRRGKKRRRGKGGKKRKAASHFMNI